MRRPEALDRANTPLTPSGVFRKVWPPKKRIIIRDNYLTNTKILGKLIIASWIAISSPEAFRRVFDVRSFFYLLIAKNPPEAATLFNAVCTLTDSGPACVPATDSSVRMR